MKNSNFYVNRSVIIYAETRNIYQIKSRLTIEELFLVKPFHFSFAAISEIGYIKYKNELAINIINSFLNLIYQVYNKI